MSIFPTAPVGSLLKGDKVKKLKRGEKPAAKDAVEPKPEAPIKKKVARQ